MEVPDSHVLMMGKKTKKSEPESITAILRNTPESLAYVAGLVQELVKDPDFVNYGEDTRLSYPELFDYFTLTLSHQEKYPLTIFYHSAPQDLPQHGEVEPVEFLGYLEEILNETSVSLDLQFSQGGTEKARQLDESFLDLDCSYVSIDFYPRWIELDFDRKELAVQLRSEAHDYIHTLKGGGLDIHNEKGVHAILPRIKDFLLNVAYLPMMLYGLYKGDD